MTDRPIIFSAPMIAALLAGTKTQTRRLLKPQPHDWVRYVGLPYAIGDRLIPCVMIAGFDGMYAAGIDGQIWSFAKDDERRLAATPPNGKGYPSVSLLLPTGKTTRRSVHRLVCQAFYGPPPTEEHECRHLDGNPMNGRPSNLAWGTREENWMDRKAHGRGCEGEKHHDAKFSDAERAHIRWAVEHGLTSARSVARALGVRQSTVHAICHWSPSIAIAPDADDRIPDITLTVTDVRVQRVQEISRSDAIAEGLTLASNAIEEFWRWPPPHDSGLWLSPVAAYANLWNTIHGPGAWDRNDWVCALTFTVRKGNIDQ